MKEAGGSSLAALALDSRLCEPLHQQLYDRVRNAILDCQLRAGTRLPSTRSIAAELGISRNTVLTAFEQLIAEGYLEAKVGAGTFVAEKIPDDLLSLRNRVTGRPWNALQPRLSRRTAAIPAIRSRVAGSPRTPFRRGVPAIDLFPAAVWSRLVTRQWKKIAGGDSDLLTTGDAAGLPRLREAIARYVGASRGVTCDPAQVIITTGVHQGLSMTARVLLDPGDKVWIEDPGYPVACAALTAADASVVSVPVTEEGLDVRYGLEKCPSPRLIYVTPSHQYPLGVTMSVSRRLELLDLARRADAWILEDDYDSEYRLSTHPLPSMQGLDRSDRVIYFGTFSKVLFPALRIGYVIVPPALADVFTRARALAGRQSPPIDQAVIADFIDEGLLDRHIRRMRAVYRERQHALLDAARESLDGLLSIEPSDTGLHVLGWLDGIDDETAAATAAEFGVEVAPLSWFCADVPRRDALLLGYGALTPDEIRAGAAKLARALESLTPWTAGAVGK